MHKSQLKAIGIGLAIFIFAGSLRLTFLYQVPQPSVAYDAVSYLKTTRYLMGGVPWGKVVYRPSRRNTWRGGIKLSGDQKKDIPPI